MDQPEPPLTDPYAVLGVPRDADAATIKAAYRAEARKHHPDVGGDPERAAAITRAYRLLSDPGARATLDHRAAAADRAWEAARGARLFGRLPVRVWSALAWLLPIPAFPVAFFVGGEGLWGLRFAAAQSALWLGVDALLVGAASATDGVGPVVVAAGLRLVAAALTLAGRDVRAPGMQKPAASLADLGGAR